MAVEGGSSLHRVLQQGAGGFSNFWHSNDMHIFWHVFDQSSVQLWQAALSHRVFLAIARIVLITPWHTVGRVNKYKMTRDEPAAQSLLHSCYPALTCGKQCYTLNPKP